MSNNNQNAIDKYLTEQAKYSDSPYSKFFNSFSLNWILNNLNKDQKEKFLKLLEEEKNEELLEFIAENITDFDTRLITDFEKEIERIKENVRKDTQHE